MYLCNCTSGCRERCQQTLTWDWPHAFMDTAQPLSLLCLILYIGQDQAHNVFTRDFNSYLHSAAPRPHSLLDKDRWSLSLLGFSPVCLFVSLWTPPLSLYVWHVFMWVYMYLCVYVSINPSIRATFNTGHSAPLIYFKIKRTFRNGLNVEFLFVSTWSGIDRKLSYFRRPVGECIWATLVYR